MPFASPPITASMSLDVSDPPVLGRFFLFLRKMEQQVEPAEIRVFVDDGLGLLVLKHVQLMDGIDQVTQQLKFFFAKRNVRVRDTAWNISIKHL
jgi:hypothetical protein